MSKYQAKSSTSSLAKPSSKTMGLKSKIEEIKKEYKYYQKNIEEHPLYKSTWQVFWQEKYAEIKQEGKSNPEDYDYKKDWVVYWMKYIKDFYENKIKFYSQKQENQEKLQASPISISSSSDSDSSDYSSVSSVSNEKPKENKRKREIYSSVSSASLSEEPNDDVSLLLVCRTLSVLDAELGSFMSNKILDIVGQIIQLEKIQANSSDLIIQNNENMIFLETVKEKLKGLLSNNLLEAKKIPIVKKCIQNIAQLAKIVQKNPVNYLESVGEKSENLDANCKLTEIIMKALVYFGKTDVSEDELEVITEIYLEELEKNIKRPSTIECNSPSDFSCPKDICYQNLSDDELKILVKNFTQLSDEEQRGIINFITEIEEKQPERVEKLQNLINHSEENTERIIIDDDDDDYNLDDVIKNILN